MTVDDLRAAARRLGEVLGRLVDAAVRAVRALHDLVEAWRAPAEAMRRQLAMLRPAPLPPPFRPVWGPWPDPWPRITGGRR